MRPPTWHPNGECSWLTPPAELPKGTGADSVIGVGLDSCVTRTRHPGIALVQVTSAGLALLRLSSPGVAGGGQTTDFFYPLVDDPYIQVFSVMLAFFLPTQTSTTWVPGQDCGGQRAQRPLCHGRRRLRQRPHAPLCGPASVDAAADAAGTKMANDCFLAMSLDMTPEQRMAVTPLLMRGFAGTAC